MQKKTSNTEKMSIISKFLVIVGKGISFLGHYAIPLAVGLIIGFYVSDHGFPWLPTTLEAVMLILVFGFLAIPLGRILQGKSFKDSEEKHRIRKRIIVFCILASLVTLLRLILFHIETPSPLTRLSHENFNRAYDIDLERFKIIQNELKGTNRFLENNKSIFTEKSENVLTSIQEVELLQVWQSIYNNCFVLDQIRLFYEDWYRYDPSRRERSFLLRSYLLTYACELLLYKNGLYISSLVRENKNAVKYLDAPHIDFDLPENSFSTFRKELTGNRDVARIVAGKQYLKLLESGFNGRNEAHDLGVSWLWDSIEQMIEELEQTNIFVKAAKGVRADLQSVKKSISHTWLFTQGSIARWMGDTRVRRIGTYLINEEQCAIIEKKLKPGDIIIARKNWYLSNVGLPGFWPHSILYLGDRQKFTDYFNSPEILDYFSSLGEEDQTLDMYLAHKFPLAWEDYCTQSSKEPNRVIEAVSEGVIFNTLAHVTGDYAAGLRPVLDKVAKAQSIIEAFSDYGKSYDYDFDFATDHTLVCSELVWRSYRPAPEKKGLIIPLITVMGRKTLPTNEFAKLYAQEITIPNHQLEFVFFLDANEHRKAAFFSDQQEFIKSCERTKWDLMLP